MIKIRFNNVHRLPAKSIMDITWPKELTFDPSKLKCWSDSNSDGFRRCKLLAGRERTIRMYDINFETLKAGMTINIEIEGLINSKFSSPTSSFIITTLTPDAKYLIDTKDKGLPVFLSCDYPCKGCKVNQPNVCTDCNLGPKDKFPYYFKNQCMEKCPQSWYPFTMKNKICSQCDSNCLECATQRDKCTKCA
jgi:hypothetical protein